MKHMEFNLAEKMAVIKSIEDVIMADGRIDNREIDFMKQLSFFLNFNMNLIEEARKMNKEEGRLILSGMPKNKKQALSLILREMASADGRVDDEEIAMLHDIFAEAGINL
jgi:uncharacterized tellurite resistance protein B-like protein